MPGILIFLKEKNCEAGFLSELAEQSVIIQDRTRTFFIYGRINS
ncbi:hypothetical protein LEP1GSC050_3071 [Leptospira broomii serovar Hurstbridge str. 5399]|uniref:Uncharacterized protein n=1 Tax=Leptospira broomii serovar Hurstbridge str. 5399 TaxID=1049789 RepID=T0F8A4_9LEPT|nr:hypothetical protein LEP1GSC050_3071 [Leptospira broomii serovar Hurstbridge str. 5399]